jgi:hypothetical protein
MTAISAPVQSVLDLFQGPLANVRFADIDAAGLSKLAADVEAVASEVSRQEAAVAELRQTLSVRQEALLGLAQQALAYARVYADGDEALLEELNRIALPRAPKARKPSSPKAASTRDSNRDESAGDVAPVSEPAADETAEPVEVAAAEDLHEDPPAPPLGNGFKGDGSKSDAPRSVVAQRNGRKARRANGHGAMR